MAAVEVRRSLPYATGDRTSSTSLPKAGDRGALTAPEIHEAGHHGACRRVDCSGLRPCAAPSKRHNVISVGGREPSAAYLVTTPEASHTKTACGSRGGRGAGRCRLRQRAPPLSEPSRHLGERHEQRRGTRNRMWPSAGMTRRRPRPLACRRSPPRQLPAERVDRSCSTDMRRRRTSAAARASGQRVARRVAATSRPQMTAR
jgi:hypothetical protein